MGRAFRVTFIVLAAAALGASAAIAWHTRERRNWFYSDAATIRQAASEAAVRDVLWQPAARLPGVSSDSEEYEPRISEDGQTMFFVRGKAGGNADIWWARRDREAWSVPQPLAAVNSPGDDLGPEPAADGSALYFYSDREGGAGGYDLWISRRAESEWEAPTNLGPAANSPFNDYGPALAPDGGTLYFSSNRPGPGDPAPDEGRWPATVRELHEARDYDLFTCAITDRGLGEAARLDQLSTGANEGTPSVSPYGDFLYFSSDRPGGLGGFDLYRARRLNDRLGEAESLGPAINSSANDLDPALSMGGFALTFSSNRAEAAGTEPPATPDYDLYRSYSREVFREFETTRARIDWAAILPWLWWLLPLALLPLLLWLLRKAAGDDRFRRLSLLAKCLLLSALVHALILLCTAFWYVGNSLDGWLRPSGGTRIAIESPGGGGEIASQILGEMTSIAFEPMVSVETVRFESSDDSPARADPVAFGADPSRPEITTLREQTSAADAPAPTPPELAPRAVETPESTTDVATPRDPRRTAAAEAEVRAPQSPALPQAPRPEQAAEISTARHAEVAPSETSVAPVLDGSMAAAESPADAPATPAATPALTAAALGTAGSGLAAPVAVPTAGARQAVPEAAAPVMTAAPESTRPAARPEWVPTTVASLNPSRAPAAAPERSIAGDTEAREAAGAPSPAPAVAAQAALDPQPVGAPVPVAVPASGGRSANPEARPEMAVAGAPPAERADVPRGEPSVASSAALRPAPFRASPGADRSIAAGAPLADASPKGGSLPSSPAAEPVEALGTPIGVAVPAATNRFGGAEVSPTTIPADGPGSARPPVASEASHSAVAAVAPGAAAVPARGSMAPKVESAAEASPALGEPGGHAEALALSSSPTDLRLPAAIPGRPSGGARSDEARAGITVAAPAPVRPTPSAEGEARRTGTFAVATSPVQMPARSSLAPPTSDSAAPAAAVGPGTPVNSAGVLSDLVMPAVPLDLPTGGGRPRETADASEGPAKPVFAAPAGPRPMVDQGPIRSAQAALSPDATPGTAARGLLRKEDVGARTRDAGTPRMADIVVPTDPLDLPAIGLRLPDEVATSAEASGRDAADPKRVLTGLVLDDSTGEPLHGARVRLDLPDGKSLVVRTGPDGSYTLRPPRLPDHVAVSASRRGYTPSSIGFPASALADGFTHDFRLTPVERATIALEADPQVHHLGDGEFAGRINSQFQKPCEGLVYEAGFRVTADQARARGEAEVRILAKGLQGRNELRINGRLLESRFTDSPSDGSYGTFRARFPQEWLQSGDNLLSITSVHNGHDFDDFEFVNVRVVVPTSGSEPPL